MLIENNHSPHFKILGIRNDFMGNINNVWGKGSKRMKNLFFNEQFSFFSPNSSILTFNKLAIILIVI